jgi:hypothetical protein
MTHTLTLRSRTFFGWRRLSAFASLSLVVIAALLLTGCPFAGGAKSPKVTQQPSDRGVFLGQSARFTIGAEGRAPLSYQWQRDSAAIAGATDVAYTTPPATTADDGAKFSVVITNSKGTATSSEATLTVFTAATVTTNPTDQTVNVGATATFSVTGAGESLTYQWYKDDIAITTGATAATYTTPATVATDDGAIFTVDVINGSGRATSTGATLTVLGAAAVVTPPASQSVNV